MEKITQEQYSPAYAVYLSDLAFLGEHRDVRLDDYPGIKIPDLVAHNITLAQALHLSHFNSPPSDYLESLTPSEAVKVGEWCFETLQEIWYDRYG